MPDENNTAEPVGPQARLEAELFRLESQRRELWILIAFLIGVLTLGGLSLLFPLSFWHLNVLEIRISPQLFFLLMMVLVVLVLYMLKREVTIQKLRLQNLRQTLAAQSESSASMLDPLTTVFSRKVLRELLQGEIARAERGNRALVLIMCDLNNLKQLNDRFGHLMGDYVLAQFAATLKTCVRGSDYIVRYGGDEFLIILPETDKKGAETVRNRITTKVADWDRHHRVGDIPITVSIGMHHHVVGQSAEQDVAEADAYMYAEKQRQHAQGGPNNVLTQSS
jgi:diguanylate cyclase (GGDEF)-like protein